MKLWLKKQWRVVWWFGLFSDVSHCKSPIFTGSVFSNMYSVCLSSTWTLELSLTHSCPSQMSPHSLLNTRFNHLIYHWCWHKEEKNASVQLIHDHLIQLFMIKDFYIVRAQLWLLIVVFVEMYLLAVINKPETWGITCVLSECYRQTAWQNQVRIAGENICHYWTEGLCAALLQHDQSQLHLSNWLHWECMQECKGGAGRTRLLHPTAAVWAAPLIPHHIMQQVQ